MFPEEWTFGNPEPHGVNDYWWYNEQLSRRKRYLFMASVAAHVAPLMSEPECARVPQICHDYAEGQLDDLQFYDLMEDANSARCRSPSSIASESAANAFVTFLEDEGKLNECVEAAECAFGYVAAANSGDLAPDTPLAAWEASQRYESFRAGMAEASRLFTTYCLDIFGPSPFRPSEIDQSWRTSTTLALAEGIYDDRAFDRLPILADALEDAGCDAAELLAHLRGDGPHVRGCWALDLVLGKT